MALFPIRTEGLVCAPLTLHLDLFSLGWKTLVAEEFNTIHTSDFKVTMPVQGTV